VPGHFAWICWWVQRSQLRKKDAPFIEGRILQGLHTLDPKYHFCRPDSVPENSKGGFLFVREALKARWWGEFASLEPLAGVIFRDELPHEVERAEWRVLIAYSPGSVEDRSNPNGDPSAA
jgi:hypothetical protein